MLYRLTKIISSPFLRVLWRPKVVGAHHVPASGPAILASNHLSIVDSVFLPLMLPRQVTFVAKAEYFTGNRLMAMFMRGTGQVAIDRQSAAAAQQMLDAAVQVLKAGELFGIYPEGTRSPDGRLYRGKVGVAWLALTTGAPVIPVAMVNTERVLPPGASVPRIAKIGVRIGEPMTFQGDAARARDRRAVTDEVMAAIQRLSGQEYVPAYAAGRKEQAQRAA
ncbi:1-acyl-sn-glycerol-3-phosphate acyltransferase [Sphaerisporangium melleum]|uniref:1-acyl-sn-glycerol-3-phosphate acyltransferase n=1 Tax=Sphaerisporangium melleum TaxID=321316 RepID=A0A917RD47_9ACTN|nr:lysophospholipid acyltransferase family protein [Sphaerisporangium melleum]GGL01796.1 1-acyl-sn-glycerol-3-phosphate acyltransferase [Sphaerisporangium melleum]GII72169.1 1-acyl-sn-glycerol-3-phosphate acyltransferase [Sphaerisporangium melleum]